MSFIIAAYNEEAVIEKKIQNTLNQNYPKDKLQIIIASDGSTDKTNEIVSKYEKQGIRLLELPRGGKGVALNQAVKEAAGQILVFSDANSILKSNALQELINNFNDPKVGGVSGYQTHDINKVENSIGDSESLYWSYDVLLKKLESSLGSIVGADGSLYAIRTNLYVPITNLTQVDDMTISTGVITKGYRLIFEPNSVSSEPSPDSLGKEFQRKIRISNRTVPTLINLIKELDISKSKLYFFELISHKVLRYIVPFSMLTAFISNIVLSLDFTVFIFFLLIQILFYSLVILGYFFHKRGLINSKILYTPFYFFIANLAVFIGVMKYITGKRTSIWNPHRD